MTAAMHAGQARAVPGDEGRFVLSGRPLRAGCAPETGARFSDDVWDLSPAQLKKHDRRLILDFGLIPGSCRKAGKELCYAMLSGTLPPGEGRPATASVRTSFTDFVRFLRWTAGRAAGPGALTEADLEDYQRFLISTVPNTQSRHRARTAVRKFWLWRDSMPSGGLRFDPLRIDGWSTPQAPAHENATDRIPEEVLGPLFVWAMRFIDDFSADILAADRHWRTPLPPVGTHAYGQARVQLQAWLDNRITAGQPLPSWRRGRASVSAIAAELGLNEASLRHYRHLIDQAAAIVGTAPQVIGIQPVLGRLDGQPWIEAILANPAERDSLAALARFLQDACYIALAFLSGARDSELKHLQRGCLTIERDADGTPYRWKIRSLAFKGEADPAGAPATWSIGEPAARAITVLEQLQPPGSQDLFARLEHNAGTRPSATNSVLTSGTTNTRLNAFTAWVNDYCQRHGRADGIPPVRDRPWHLVNSQFRRTLAWFIARRPGGVIAGALAYRHHCVQVFEGYAGTSESGFRAEVESEQALARGQHLMASVEAHQHTLLAGPAADEAARRLEEFGERAGFGGTVVLDDSRLRRLMARHDPAVYPGEYVTCVYDHSKALCEKARARRGEELPDHGSCKPLACHNVALTTGNLASWHDEIDKITERLAARPPLPPLLRRRLADRRTEIAAFLGRVSEVGPPA